MSICAPGTHWSDTAVDTGKHACGRYVNDDVQEQQCLFELEGEVGARTVAVVSDTV